MEKMKAHEKFKVIFTPKLFWRFWLQMGHCEKAQSCTVNSLMQKVNTRERIRNRAAMKSRIRHEHAHALLHMTTYTIHYKGLDVMMVEVYNKQGGGSVGSDLIASWPSGPRLKSMGHESSSLNFVRIVPVLLYCSMFFQTYK